MPRDHTHLRTGKLVVPREVLLSPTGHHHDGVRLRAERPVSDFAAEPSACREILREVQVLQVVRLIHARHGGEKRAL